MRKKVSVSVAVSVIGIGFLAGCSHLASTSRNLSALVPPANRKVVRATLANGLEVAIVPSRLAAVATSMLTYKAGSAQAPNGFPGMAHYLQHLVFAGGPGATGRQVGAIARAVGGDLAGETTATQTRFIFTVPAGDLETALRLQAIGMRGITSEKSQWSREQMLLQAEIGADNTNPQYWLSARLRGDLFKGTPYGPDALGSNSSLNEVTLAELTKFHAAWYVPNNAILVIAGDVVPKTALSEVRSIFGSIPRRTLPDALPHKLPPVVPETLTLKSHFAYGAAAIALRFPGRNSADYPAAVVLSEIVRGRPGGLDAIVSSGLAFGAGFTYDAFPKSGVGMIDAAYSPNGDATTVEERLMLVLAKYMNGGISPAVVRAAKLRAELDIQTKMDSVSGLATQWSLALAAGDSSPRSLLESIAGVTAAEVNRVAVHYVDLGKAEFATLTPLSSGSTVPLSSRGFGGPEPIDLNGPGTAALPSWARSISSEPAMPASIAPTDLRLSNGLRLIVQPEHTSSVVDLYGLVNTDPYVQTPKGEGGVNRVLSRLMSTGTASMSGKAFDSALYRAGAKETAGTTFSLQVLSPHFDRGVQLLAENLLKPRFATAAFKADRRLVSRIVAAQAKNPPVLARSAFLKAVLPANDPALRRATKKSVDSLTIAKVRSYYHAVFRPDMTTIVVIGAISPKVAKTAIERYFGGWSSDGKKPNTRLPASGPTKSSVTDVKDPGTSVDQVRLAEVIPVDRSSSSYFALQLATEILSGNSYPGVLPGDLRTANVPVPYVTSSFIAGRSRSFYLIDFATDPASVGAAISVIRRAIAQIRKRPPGGRELRRALGDLLRTMLLSETGYSSIANGLLRRVRLGLPLDEPLLAARAYSRLTAEQVRAAMAKWVRPADLAEVVQGPAPPN